MAFSDEGKVGIGLGILGLAGGGAIMVAPEQLWIGWTMIAVAALSGGALLIYHFRRPRSAPVPHQHEPYRGTAVQKIFIKDSPEFLIGLYKNRTSVQANALAAIYLNKWISVTGAVADIDEHYDGGLLVIIAIGIDKLASAHFRNEDKEKISHVASGTVVTVSGELQRINDHSINLINCDLAN